MCSRASILSFTTGSDMFHSMFLAELEKITQVTLEKDSAHSLLMHWQLECSALKSYVNSYQIEACAVLPRHQKMALHDAAGEPLYKHLSCHPLALTEVLGACVINSLVACVFEHPGSCDEKIIRCLKFLAYGFYEERWSELVGTD